MTSTSPLHSGVADESALSHAIEAVRRNLRRFAGVYPDDTTVGERYLPRPAGGGIPEGGNRGWTTSFWPGMQWLAWELTGEEGLRDAALGHARDFERRVRAEEDLDTHDLGFLYSLSCVAAWRLVEDEPSRQAALLATEHLMRRFLEPAGIIQAWGDLKDPRQQGRTIIDSLMNVPLLTWAADQTGAERFAEAAARHVEQLRRHILREDGSTYHTFYWDPLTGEPLRGATEQGAHDDSCWARGQAWGIYGFALNHRTLGDDRLLEASRRCAEYFVKHLPADGVPYWDLVYGDDSDAPRDSSAAAIAACGMLELAAQESDADEAARWRDQATAIMTSLAGGYAPEPPESSDALLLHSVYDLPKGVGVDEGSLWGDYFYLEALMRLARPDWTPYW